VDRYGQPEPQVRTLLHYGLDNQIDGVVLDVLLRKHQTIRNSLGISVPVPVDTNKVIEAVFEGLLLREQGGSAQYLPGFEEFMKPQKDELFSQWEAASEREKRSRTMFAQETIKVDEVAHELQAAQAAIGSGVDLAAFAREAVRACGGTVSGGDKPGSAWKFDFRETPEGLRDVLGVEKIVARYELPVRDEEVLLTRTHPIVEGLATYVMDAALDPLGQGPARRCGAIRTSQVSKRTTVLLIRARYHIVKTEGDQAQPLLAEECLTLAFASAPDNAEWLDESGADQLLRARPDGNINPEQASEFVSRVVDGFAALNPHIGEIIVQHGEALLEAHKRVREVARLKDVRYQVEPQVPPDVLGICVYLPSAK
jgi:hypothetical protein